MLQTWSNHWTLTNVFCYAVSDPNILMIWKLIIILSCTQLLADMELLNISEGYGYLSQTIYLVLLFLPSDILCVPEAILDWNIAILSLYSGKQHITDLGGGWMLICVIVSWPHLTMLSMPLQNLQIELITAKYCAALPHWIYVYIVAGENIVNKSIVNHVGNFMFKQWNLPIYVLFEVVCIVSQITKKRFRVWNWFVIYAPSLLDCSCVA